MAGGNSSSAVQYHPVMEHPGRTELKRRSSARSWRALHRRGTLPTSALLLLASLLVACAVGKVADQRTADGGVPPDGGAAADAGNADAGSVFDAGIPASGCGSGGGGPQGGPADLFPCDSAWARDVSDAGVASVSASLIAALAARGFGPDFGADPHHLQVTFDFTLLHAAAGTPRIPVTVNLYPGDSDLLAPPDQGHALPTPPGGATEGVTDYQCDVSSFDCHTLVVDDAKHLLYELGSSTLDGGSTSWLAGQESVWNLQWHYGGAERGLSCTSADAAGLPIAAGLIGLREMLAAAQTPGGSLHHALRFILPNTRIAAAWIAPASHLTRGLGHPADGIPYGTRLRLRADFDESLVTSPGAKVLVRTLKRYGMILADGGQIAFTAERDDWYRARDPALTWGNVLGPTDLDALSVGDFEIVDWDGSTIHTPSSTDNCVVDAAPLQGVLP